MPVSYTSVLHQLVTEGDCCIRYGDKRARFCYLHATAGNMLSAYITP